MFRCIVQLDPKNILILGMGFCPCASKDLFAEVRGGQEEGIVPSCSGREGHWFFVRRVPEDAKGWMDDEPRFPFLL